MMKGKNQTLTFSDVDHDVINDHTDDRKTFPNRKRRVRELPVSNPNPFFDICLIDYSGRQFSCTHGNCQKHSVCFKNGRLQEGLDFHELHFHAEDRMLWCEEAFPDMMKFFDSVSAWDFPDYRFVFNHRYIRKDGSITQFMHEGSIIFTEDQLLPVLNLKVFFEIADIKTDDTIVLTIFQYSADQGYQKVFTKEYGRYSNSLLTQREMEVIRLCHEGLSSKMIAEELKLSIHTVKNHKRHCMDKTSTHNITELIHVCLNNHWL
ncbi:MAG: helix-turn-helix transcriptional regulator [Bacteroidota bacterium]|nr:helix-turn-helix transcriptional regulator [Bacteroidota bacterium]